MDQRAILDGAETARVCDRRVPYRAGVAELVVLLMKTIARLIFGGDQYRVVQQVGSR